MVALRTDTEPETGRKADNVKQKRVRYLTIYLCFLAVLVLGPPMWHRATVSSTQEAKNQLLFTAILHNDTAAVKAAIQAGADVNAEMQGWAWTDFVHPLTNAFSGDMSEHLRDTPLLITMDCLVKRDKKAVKGDIPLENLDTVKALVEAGADVNARNNIGDTALEMAVEWGYRNTVEYLLKNRADPRIGDTSGATPLHSAAMDNRMEIMTDLLNCGASPDARDILGDTPLIDLVKLGSGPKQIDEARLLLQHGANPNIKNKDGETALSDSLAGKSSDLVKLLQEHGAK